MLDDWVASALVSLAVGAAIVWAPDALRWWAPAGAGVPVHRGAAPATVRETLLAVGALLGALAAATYTLVLAGVRADRDSTPYRVVSALVDVVLG